MKLSVYGSTGFIGGNFVNLYPSHYKIKREDRKPLSNNILYFISTLGNYNLDIDASIDIKTNLLILCEVLNYCKNEKVTFNFISSSLVYGNPCSLPAKETSICKPKCFYSITKKCAEDLLISFSETFGIKYRIIRLCSVLGKGNKELSNRNNTLTQIINKLKMNQNIELNEVEDQVREIIHIEDACRAIELICQKGSLNKIYNLGSGEIIKMESFINYAKEKLQSKSKIIYLDTSISKSLEQKTHFWMDSKRLNDLGFKKHFCYKDIINDICN